MYFNVYAYIITYTNKHIEFFLFVQSLSCVWLCDPMDYSMPVSSILNCFLEFAQIHVCWVSDAI